MNITPINFRPYSPTFSAKKQKNNYRPTEKPEPYKKNNVNKEAAMALLGMLSIGVPMQQLKVEFDKNNGFERVTSEQSSFDTRAEALSYAKRKVTDALKEEKPYEYSVWIDNKNNISGEFKGDSVEVKSSIPLLSTSIKRLLGDYSLTSVHGHPDGKDNKTTPISPTDCITLINNPLIKESIVFNKNGEYSILRKTDNFRPLDEEEQKRLIESYYRFMIGSFSEKYPEKLLNRDLNKNFAMTDIAKENIDLQFINEVDNFLYDIDGIKLINIFWEQVAPEIGLEYKTNYSYLK